MKPELYVHNTLSGKKEKFNPISPPFVGLYVCGPTVYGEAHLGHARSAITFDIVFRYLRELGYKVRYVRNITDVGHLTGDADEGEDKIQKKARLEQLEPMEVADYYADRYHEDLRKLNVLRPSLEPRATGHIIEQIAFITKIIENGYAYESDGSVYFDVATYAKDHSYGELSGRIPDELLNTTRQLSGQEEKRNPQDFALWKKASTNHLMRWPSPWSDGFPGWHIECSAMSSRYLGEEFDIHGGGMDLLFPHHESEVAQSRAVTGKGPARYWLHNNMITVDGQKMGKSLNNFINIQQLLNGDHPRLEQAYDPMTLRFFVLQAHYRGTLDFSNEALQAAGKALNRLSNAADTLKTITPSGSGSEAVKLKEKAYQALSDDFNTPIAIAQLFDAAHLINNAKAGMVKLSKEDISALQHLFDFFLPEILGIVSSEKEAPTEVVDGLMNLILDIRQGAKNRKDFSVSDHIRDQLKKLNIQVKDGKEGVQWEYEN